MRKHEVSRAVVIGIVAVLLALVVVGGLGHQSAHAQAQQYAVEIITANFGSRTFETDLASAINNAGKGRELVTIIKDELPGKYVVIYKK